MGKSDMEMDNSQEDESEQDTHESCAQAFAKGLVQAETKLVHVETVQEDQPLHHTEATEVAEGEEEEEEDEDEEEEGDEEEMEQKLVPKEESRMHERAEEMHE